MHLQHRADRSAYPPARPSERPPGRDMALTPGISEGERVAAHCGPLVDGAAPMKARCLLADWSRIVAAIDLDFDYDAWAHGFAVEERHSGGAMQRSLQFFDGQGHALHKVFLRPESAVAGFHGLIEEFAAPRLSAGSTRLPEAVGAQGRSDADALRAQWVSMRDAETFPALLRAFGIAPTQALRLAPAGEGGRP